MSKLTADISTDDMQIIKVDFISPKLTPDISTDDIQIVMVDFISPKLTSSKQRIALTLNE